MLRKIISGGQTGADQSALDVAIKFNIPHGGWIPKGRKTENGPLHEKYQLMEMESTDYRERTRKNIMVSDGTVIISRGRLSGGSKLTQSYAKVLGKPNTYLDLLNTEDFEAAIFLKSFIQENQIRTLNVAGPRLSHHPWIYGDVKTILETALYLLFLDARLDKSLEKYVPKFSKEMFDPDTVQKAVQILYEELPLKTRTFIARAAKDQIQQLYFLLLEYIRVTVGFDSNNDALLKDCATLEPDQEVTVEDAVMIILKQLKKRLETDHVLRVVK